MGNSMLDMMGDFYRRPFESFEMNVLRRKSLAQEPMRLVIGVQSVAQPPASTFQWLPSFLLRDRGACPQRLLFP